MSLIATGPWALSEPARPRCGRVPGPWPSHLLSPLPPRPAHRRLLRSLHPVLPVLRVPDAVQHCPGLRHVRLLQLGGLVPLLLLLRLRRVRRLRPALRPGLRHPGRLLRVGGLPGDLHGVLWALLLLLTGEIPAGSHTARSAPAPGPLSPATCLRRTPAGGEGGRDAPEATSVTEAGPTAESPSSCGLPAIHSTEDLVGEG